MTPRSILSHAAVAVAMMSGAAASAQTFDFVSEQRGINTGVRLQHTGLVREDGLPITLPIQDYLANKEYTFQVVPPGSRDANESYAQFSPTDKGPGFGSALADGAGALEVGVFNRHSVIGADVAVSRFNIHLKNSSDQAVRFNFEYEIPGGEVEVIDFSEKFTAEHSRVEATIDYLLLSPTGEFGGTYEETTGRLLDFFVDLDGDVLTRTGNAAVRELGRSPIGPSVGYEILPFDNIAILPTIPAFGELYLYYDMYALTSTGALDGHLGHAQLGDPTDLIRGPGVRLVQTAVPEPSALMLLGSGLAGAIALGGRSASRRPPRPA